MSGMPGQTTVTLEGTTNTKSGMPAQFTLSKPVTTPVSSASQPGMHQHFLGTQKFLQPQASECPSWTPPPRDYINKATDCQTCKVMTTDVCVCDTREKAYHLKGIHTSTGKVPRGKRHWECHCAKCLPKMLSTTSALQSTSEKKAVMPNRRPTILTGPAGSTVGTPPNNILPLKQVFAKSHKDYSDGKKVDDHSTVKSMQDDSGTVSIPPEIFTNTSGRSEHDRPIPNFMNSVDWTGRMFKIEDQKAFYHSCCINGIVYRVKDHVLVRFSNRLIPSKIEAMWEDTNKKTNWVNVNPYYYPSDLPKTVGRPFRLERSEVYGSIISCTVLAGFIQGPCEVLSPSKFLEENERRAIAGKIRKKRKKPNETLPPLFLCKWIYDESKVLFRDVIIC